MLLMVIARSASAQGTTTVISIQPSTLEIPSPNQVFKVNVTVQNVQNLALWQIFIEFDPNVLECQNASIPADNIFAGKAIIAPDPVIDNDAGTVLYGASVFPMVGVSGSGILCQIEFKAKVEGISQLHIVTYDEEPEKTFCTKLEDPDGERIQYEAIDGEVTIIPENILLIAIPALTLTMTVAIIRKKRSLKP